MSPRPRLDHLRKPQIVEAAAEVLYERGLFDTRIGDIAERAGTSAPTILYYFESKDRLLEEARHMARLEHPNVVSVFDVGTFGDDVFVAMEYVRGVSLREWCR